MRSPRGCPWAGTWGMLGESWRRQGLRIMLSSVRPVATTAVDDDRTPLHHTPAADGPAGCQSDRSPPHFLSDPMQRDELLRLLLDRRGAILGYIGTILADRDAAEDVFQETLIRADAEGVRFDHAGHAMAWVRGTARNLALNEARKAHRRSVVLDEGVLDLLDRTWAAGDGTGDREELDRLEACLERLGPTARTLVRLRFAEGLDGTAIAVRVGKTAAAVHTSFSRIYKALAACMQGQPA